MDEFSKIKENLAQIGSMRRTLETIAALLIVLIALLSGILFMTIITASNLRVQPVGCIEVLDPPKPPVFVQNVPVIHHAKNRTTEH